jgi:surface polysaccharide O-acyltransferase-like enzyme
MGSSRAIFRSIKTIIMQNRSLHLDLIRVLAAFFVVCIHVDTITASASNYLGGVSWWMVNVVNTLGRSSVPLFIMLSGALLLNSKNSSFNVVVKRSWSRLILSGLIWILFYFWWQSRWHGAEFNPLTVIIGIITNSTGHLYCLSIAIGLYLATPLLVRIVRLSPLYLLISLLGSSLVSLLNDTSSALPRAPYCGG